MRNTINQVHLEGWLYQHQLTMKVSGESSKNPGTQFINGTIDIATDDMMTNIVTVHYTYVTAKTSKGTDDSRFAVLQNIINGTLCSVMEHGADKAAKLRVDTSIGLNEFYSNRNGTEELVSIKRNEGGFIHTTQTIAANEMMRNTFKCDMVINKVRRIEADEERDRPESMIIGGCIFDFRKAILPVEFTVTNPTGMDYFDSLEVTEKTPCFTQVSGSQISRVIIVRRESQGSFGEPLVEESTTTQRDFIVNWAAGETYEWDSEESITANELKEKIQERNLYLAGVKQRQDEYNASRAASTGAATAPVSASGFNF